MRQSVKRLPIDTKISAKIIELTPCRCASETQILNLVTDYAATAPKRVSRDNKLNMEQVQEKARQAEQFKRRQREVTQSGRVCPNCGEKVGAEWEFCPACGHSLVEWCTFCGSDIPRDENECPECGQPRSGIVCPKCGTLNVRGFCRKCNEPLTIAAQRELQRARQDPLVQKAAKAAVRMDELEKLMGKAETEEKQARAEDVRRKSVLDSLPQDLLELKALLTNVGGGKPNGTEEHKGKSLVELQEEYARAKKELEESLKAMLPPAGSTPQEQRNYYSARKFATTEKVRIGWVCNFCGCFHDKPSECAEPWHGGVWQYADKKVYK